MNALIFLNVIQGSLAVRSHYDLLLWLQGDLQLFLPHDILLAAWGNPALGLVFVDVISPFSAMRTEKVIDKDITPFIQGLFKSWMAAEYRPLQLSSFNDFLLDKKLVECPINAGFRKMRTAIVHGIKNQRDRHLCLYALFSEQETIPEQSISHMEMLLPHIDTALRQVAHLPQQCQADLNESPIETKGSFGLSVREFEITNWVREGKTNQEIGLILNISAFTVKNHLQRIFQKLNVTNRAQIADKLPKKNRVLIFDH